VNEASDWVLLDFLPKLDEWVAAETPRDDVRIVVTDWIFTRVADPFANARRVEGFPDYWQAVVPDSEHLDDNVELCGVVCLFWIDVRGRSVRCDRIASLSLPIT
jgi:hypothetical protein